MDLGFIHTHLYIYHVFHKLCFLLCCSSGGHQSCVLGHQNMVTALQPWGGSTEVLPAPVCCRADTSLTFLTQDRRSSGFLKQVCHSHPNNSQHTNKQIGMNFHGIFRVSLGADLDWSAVTLLFPVSKEMWLLPAPHWCSHSRMEESKKVAGTIAFC